jgi:hypothetical protein
MEKKIQTQQEKPFSALIIDENKDIENYLSWVESFEILINEDSTKAIIGRVNKLKNITMIRYNFLIDTFLSYAINSSNFQFKVADKKEQTVLLFFYIN